MDYGYPCTSSDHSSLNSIVWLADSGASQHMTDDRSFFNTFKPASSTWSVSGIGRNADPLQVHGVGNLHVRSKDGQTRVINNVQFVPGLGLNLFSISAAAKRGLKVLFTENKVELFHNNVVVLEGEKGSSKLYQFTFDTIISSSYAKVDRSSTSDNLAAYIDKVRTFETENNRLTIQIKTMHETIDHKPSSFYEKELADARQLLDETAKEKAKLQLDCNRVKTKLAEINSKYLKVKADLSLS